MDAQVPTASTQSARRPQARRRKRHWLPYFGAVILLALIVAGLWPQPVPVEFGTASRGPLRSTVDEEGKTRIKNRYVVSAPIAGQLRRIPFKAGAEVKAGETIVAIIEPTLPALLDARSRALAEARRDTAAANLDRAREAAKFADTELKRGDQLRKDKTISLQEFDTLQWRATSAAKDLVAAQSALRQAEAELLDIATGNPDTLIQLKTPSSGRVLRIFEESARIISAGTPLLEVGDPSDLEVLIDVLSRDGAAIRPGTRVDFDQWGGPKPLEGRVRHVEPSAFTKISALGVEEQRVNVIADILTPAAERPNVGDSFRVEAHIVMWETNDTLKVPSGAVFRHQGAPAVFVVRDSRAVLQKVSTGNSSGAETEIFEGLKENDSVILYPGDRIEAGAKVKPLTIAR